MGWARAVAHFQKAKFCKVRQKGHSPLRGTRPTTAAPQAKRSGGGMDAPPLSPSNAQGFSMSRKL